MSALVRHRCDVCGKFTKKEEGDPCEEFHRKESRPILPMEERERVETNLLLINNLEFLNNQFDGRRSYS